MALKRRALLGGGAALLVSGCGPDDVVCDPTTRDVLGPTTDPLSTDAFEGATSCRLFRPDQQGPYYLCVDHFRRDLFEDRAGLPLRLGLRVLDASCGPRAHAVVDVWHCDAEGRYSGFDADPDVPAGVGPPPEKNDARFCRGAQVTDAAGIVTFDTIFPGYYAGRPVHLHVRVYLEDGRRFTTQLYVDEEFTREVMARAPYNTPRDTVRVTNVDSQVASDQIVSSTLTGDARAQCTINLVLA